MGIDWVKSTVHKSAAPSVKITLPEIKWPELSKPTIGGETKLPDGQLPIKLDILPWPFAPSESPLNLILEPIRDWFRPTLDLVTHFNWSNWTELLGIAPSTPNQTPTNNRTDSGGSSWTDLLGGLWSHVSTTNSGSSQPDPTIHTPSTPNPTIPPPIAESSRLQIGIDAINAGVPGTYGWCAKWVTDSLRKSGASKQIMDILMAGSARGQYDNAVAAGLIHEELPPPPGAIVFFPDVIYQGINYGHVGIMGNDGKYYGTIPGDKIGGRNIPSNQGKVAWMYPS